MLLPEPDAPVIATSLPSGNVTSIVLQVVLARAAHGQRLAVALAPLLRHGDRPLAREELPGRRRLALEHVGDRALHDHGAAVHAGTRAHLDDVIGGADGVFVVLDDDHGVADVAQALERRDHLDVVLRVQADARLVEHVEHAHQPRADLRGQPDALRFAAGQRAGAAIEVQVVEPDAEQQLEAAANLLQHLASGVGAAAGRLDRAEKRVQLVEVELPELVDRLAGDREQQARRAEPRAVAVGAGVLDHHLVEPRFHPRVGFAALAVAPVVALDAAGDAAEADLLALRDRRASPSRRAATSARASSARCRRGSRLRAVSGRSLPRRVEREVAAPSPGCTSSGRPTCPGCT